MIKCPPQNKNVSKLIINQELVVIPSNMLLTSKLVQFLHQN